MPGLFCPEIQRVRHDVVLILYHVLAEEADGVGHVGAERRSEDDLGNAGLRQICALLLDHLGCSSDGECVDLLVTNKLSNGLEVEPAECFLDLGNIVEVETVAGEEVWG